VGKKYKADNVGEISSWLVIWGLINDAKLLQNLGLWLLLDQFKVVSFFNAIALNVHRK
jgi:hypothetical protein